MAYNLADEDYDDQLAQALLLSRMESEREQARAQEKRLERERMEASERQRQREERELLRRQQDEEYRASLAADRRKEELKRQQSKPPETPMEEEEAEKREENRADELTEEQRRQLVRESWSAKFNASEANNKNLADHVQPMLVTPPSSPVLGNSTSAPPASATLSSLSSSPAATFSSGSSATMIDLTQSPPPVPASRAHDAMRRTNSRNPPDVAQDPFDFRADMEEETTGEGERELSRDWDASENIRKDAARRRKSRNNNSKYSDQETPSYKRHLAGGPPLASDYGIRSAAYRANNNKTTAGRSYNTFSHTGDASAIDRNGTPEWRKRKEDGRIGRSSPSSSSSSYATTGSAAGDKRKTRKMSADKERRLSSSSPARADEGDVDDFAPLEYARGGAFRGADRTRQSATRNDDGGSKMVRGSSFSGASHRPSHETSGDLPTTTDDNGPGHRNNDVSSKKPLHRSSGGTNGGSTSAHNRRNKSSDPHSHNDNSDRHRAPSPPSHDVVLPMHASPRARAKQYDLQRKVQQQSAARQRQAERRRMQKEQDRLRADEEYAKMLQRQLNGEVTPMYGGDDEYGGDWGKSAYMDDYGTIHGDDYGGLYDFGPTTTTTTTTITTSNSASHHDGRRSNWRAIASLDDEERERREEQERLAKTMRDSAPAMEDERFARTLSEMEEEEYYDGNRGITADDQFIVNDDDDYDEENLILRPFPPRNARRLPADDHNSDDRAIDEAEAERLAREEQARADEELARRLQQQEEEEERRSREERVRLARARMSRPRSNSNHRANDRAHGVVSAEDVDAEHAARLAARAELFAALAGVRGADALNMMHMLNIGMAPSPRHWRRHRAYGNDEGDEDLSYERLLELEPVKVGLSKRRLDSMPVITYDGTATEDTSCVICMADYEVGDQIRCLSCTHRFHKECCDKWLQQNKTCPICKLDLAD